MFVYFPQSYKNYLKFFAQVKKNIYICSATFIVRAGRSSYGKPQGFYFFLPQTYYYCYTL